MPGVNLRNFESGIFHRFLSILSDGFGPSYGAIKRYEINRLILVQWTLESSKFLINLIVLRSIETTKHQANLVFDELLWE